MALHKSDKLFNTEPIRDRNHIMTFGKYQGTSIDDILYFDPAYLLWLHHNTDFELHADLFDEAERSIAEGKQTAT